MEYIIVISAIAGGIITGAAMILNSYFNARLAREKEQREYERTHNDKHISELKGIYEEALHSLDKMIRDTGMATRDQNEKLYRLEIKLRLESNVEVHDRFANLCDEISNMTKSLPALPEEFIPDFEHDDARKLRLERMKKAEQKRGEEAKKYTSELYQMYQELANDMNNHLAEKRVLLTYQKANTRKAK